MLLSTIRLLAVTFPWEVWISIDPLLEIAAAGELTCYLRRGQSRVLPQVLGILPLKVLDAILCVRLPPEVPVSSCFLVLGLTKCQGDPNCSRSSVEVDLQDVRDVICSELTLFSAIGLHKERQGLREANGIGELDERTLTQATLHH